MVQAVECQAAECRLVLVVDFQEVLVAVQVVDFRALLVVECRVDQVVECPVAECQVVPVAECRAARAVVPVAECRAARVVVPVAECRGARVVELVPVVDFRVPEIISASSTCTLRRLTIDE